MENEYTNTSYTLSSNVKCKWKKKHITGWNKNTPTQKLRYLRNARIFLY